jgi:phospholipid/cholesterol/gamma-HCH transport system substrate-binding protein
MGPHHIGRRRALALGGFVMLVVGLAGYGVLAISVRQWRVQRTFAVRCDFTNIGGVGPGDRVRLQGIDAGVVEAVVPPAQPGRPVRLVLRVDERLRGLVRGDAVARIVTEGVVGAKVVEVVPGKPDAAPLGADGVIASETPLEMADLLKRAAASLTRLDAVSSAAEQGLGQASAIAASVRNGEGSLGKLVKEDEAYHKLVTLSEQGERTLHDLEDNLDALKQTWPLSRYFNARAYLDRERVLFHPGAERDSRTLAAEDLFEPGRSVLTGAGRRKLDEVGAWFDKVKRPGSEVVIVAFSDAPRDAGLAQILTQEQAETVRKYLAARYAIGSAGWFARRKVAVVGFGTEVPRTLPSEGQDVPPRRVEVIVFTPQA